MSGRLLGLLVIALASSAALAQPAARAPREYIYGAELMTPQEREEYRQRTGSGKTDADRLQIRERHREQLRARARQRGIELSEPGGVAVKKK